MTKAKLGVTPDKRDCDHPVDEQMALARELGLTGTPMTISDTGERIMGYVRSSELVSKLDEAKRKVAATGN
ncbi:MAG: hypothetical protein OEU36_20855 [Gammaproteobacteria bacterium]|nr:hypothetical protein [Gammaproteobacteria bacterium]